MRPLNPGDEVMLHGSAAARAESYNPNYGLVVQDHGWLVMESNEDQWEVSVLWDDGRERVHRRKDLLDLKSIPRA